MINRILGIIWVVLGLLWVIKPQILKNKLKKKLMRKMKWIILSFMLFFIFTILGSVLKAHGLILKLIGIAVLIFMIRLMHMAGTKTSDKLIEWWEKKNLVFFRIWGAGFLVMGAWFLFF